MTRRLIPLVVLSFAATASACSELQTAPVADQALQPMFAKPPKAGGASVLAALQSGMTAADQPVSSAVKGGLLELSAGAFTATVNLGSLVSDANLVDCLQEPSDMPAEVLAILKNRLSGGTNAGEFAASIDRDAALAGTESVGNAVALRGAVWLQLGKNNDRIGAGFPTITYAGVPGTINDASQVRVFTIGNTTGDVRVTERYDGNGDGKIKANDPVAHLTCPLSNMDTDIVLTISPS